MDLLLDDLDDDIDVAIAAVLVAVRNNEEDLDFREVRRPLVSVDLEGWRLLDGILFYENFRMNRSIFDKLVNIIGHHLHEQGRLARMRTPVDLSVLYTVWILANIDTFRSTSEHFMKTKGVLHYHYQKIIKCLTELAPRYIKWPGSVERDIIKVNFEAAYGYPGVVGCIDGTNVTITAPMINRNAYTNRHHQYSIIVQAVCDHKMLYRDIYVGEPGSGGDRRTFYRSRLSDNLMGDLFVSEDEHLLGDGAYPLTKEILKPYIDDGALTRRQRHHNRVLSSCRATIERSFALCKGKFRRLKHFEVYKHLYCIRHIVSSFVLHNFIILHGEDCPGITDRADIQPRDLERSQELGAQKRELIAAMLYPDE